MSADLCFIPLIMRLTKKCFLHYALLVTYKEWYCQLNLPLVPYLLTVSPLWLTAHFYGCNIHDHILKRLHRWRLLCTLPFLQSPITSPIRYQNKSIGYLVIWEVILVFSDFKKCWDVCNNFEYINFQSKIAYKYTPSSKKRYFKKWDS